MKFEDIEIEKMNEEEIREIMNTEIADIKKGRKKYIEENKELLDRYEKMIVVADLLEQYKKENGLKTNILSIDEHMQHLNKTGRYKIYKFNFGYTVFDENNVKNTVQLVSNTSYTLYHGTSIVNAQKIVETNRFISPQDKDSFQYNKIFFAPLPKLCETYAKLAGTHILNNIDTREEYIVLQCDLDKFYTYVTMKEYFVWGNMDADCIQKVLLCKDGKTIREISKEELLSL